MKDNSNYNNSSNINDSNIFVNNINNTYKPFKYKYKPMDVNQDGIYRETLDELPQTVEDGPLQYKRKKKKFLHFKRASNN